MSGTPIAWDSSAKITKRIGLGDSNRNPVPDGCYSPMVMPKESFEFPCPCCGKLVEVNTRTGSARAVDPHDAKGGQDLDILIRTHTLESERLGDVFSEAKRNVDGAEQRLDQLFDDAKRRAEDEPDQKPRTPFDLD